VLRTPLSNEQRNYMNVVRGSAEALLTLLNDTLDFSKIEAGKMELERVAFPLRDVMGDATRLLAVPATQKGLELVCRVASDVPDEIVGDPNRLRQIIVNLVGNAVKFTDRGEVFVNVWSESSTTDSDDSEQVVLHFAVEDTGTGIPTEKQESIFEAFRQSDSSMTRRFGGTGLGLAISAQLVGLMDGKIWVDSEVGRGSTFHFVVPFDRPTPSKKPKRPSSPPLTGSVLIVCANAHARHAYAEVLIEHGMELHAAVSRETALSAIAKQADGDTPFGLVVIDVAVAGTDGAELAEQLRRDSATQRLPIVILIPPDQIDSVERFRRIGIEHCLTKPAKVSDFVGAVGAATGSRQKTGTTAESESPARARRVLHVLVADDSPVNQEVAAGLLGLGGHKVEAVRNGQEAVDAVRRQEFDLILMDIEMPEMDGLAATLLIREMEQGTGGRTPIVAMTAHALKESRDRCLQSGMDGYISKPIRPDELFRTLDTVMGGQEHAEPQPKA
jgi:CheY-like chemotaxis protein